MSSEANFLVSLGQALATMSLYDEGHPARERAFDASFEQLLALTADQPCVQYSFLGGETIVGNRTVTELGSWDWATKLTDASIQRIEVDADVSREAFVRFVDDMYRRVAGRGQDTSDVRQLVRAPIRFGLVKVEGGAGDAAGRGGRKGRRGGGLRGYTMAEEVAAVEWIHREIQHGVQIPMLEVETVVRSLAGAMWAGERMFIPLLMLKDYDQYTTTHACNVAVLAMGLAERLGLGPDEVRSFGVAGLLHDIGKVKIPHELLVKPGRYTDDERRVVQRHPVDGARIILERERGLGLAAVVAYEHHIFLNGEGYPSLSYPRACHYASRIVHVCDIYDALCTDRPYRAAWEPEQALAYLEEQAGRELDPDVVRAFSGMVAEAQLERFELAKGQPEVAGLAELPSAKPAPEGSSAAPS
ncbi:MAG: HD-GYP domain-containing protein [Gemmatimonadales bacterium]